MAFEGLTEKLQRVFKKLKGKGKLSEKDINEGIREVRLALLEADVNFLVVKDFIKKVTDRAVGSIVMESLTPGQQIIKIVKEQLTELMGSVHSKPVFSSSGVTKIVLVGLQGAGKTTAAVKIAKYMEKHNDKKPLLVACDVYRPAAVKQLHIMGDKAGVPVFSMENIKTPVNIAGEGLKEAKINGRDLVIFDTAGRLHIDDSLMLELKEMKKHIMPDQVLLVVDSMTGQDAVNIAESFNDKVGIDGVFLAKLDGDTRGGAALSVKAVTGRPICFVGTGEKVEDIELFYPERMASRILGMGDVLTFIEKVEQNIDKEKALKLAEKFKSRQFTLEDFLEQLKQVRNIGPLDKLMEMMPGIRPGKGGPIEVDEKEIARMEAIISSMTPIERVNPSIISGSRRRRIAMGSGTRVQQVNRLLKQFEETKRLMKQFAGMEKGFKGGRAGFPFM